MIGVSKLTQMLLISAGLISWGCGLRFSDNAKSSTSTNRVTLETKLVETGEPARPYNVEITVSSQENSNLVLVRSSRLADIAKPTDLIPSASSLTQLADVTDAQFSYLDTSVNPDTTLYYAVLQKLNQSPTEETPVATLLLPSPITVQVPAITLAITVQQSIDADKIPTNKLAFIPTGNTQRIIKFENDVQTQIITLLPTDNQYLDANVSYEKTYKYNLEVLDASGTLIATVNSNATKYDWPLIDFAQKTQVKLDVDERPTISHYEYVLEDLTKFKPIIRLQSSSDGGVSFSDVTMFTDATTPRKWSVAKSVPETLKFKISQLDRSGLPLASSQTFDLSIPKDLEVTGTQLLSSIVSDGNITGINRLKLSSATVVVGASNLNINVKKLISNSSTIIAYPTAASTGQKGLNAGSVSISVESTTGDLVVDLRGQKGAVGEQGVKGINATKNMTPATITAPTVYEISPVAYGWNIPPQNGGKGQTGYNGGVGYAGEQGKDSGNSGTIHYTVSVSDSMARSFFVDATPGGSGGPGGLGGDAGEGGDGEPPGELRFVNNLGGMYWYIRYPYTAPYSWDSRCGACATRSYSPGQVINGAAVPYPGPKGDSGSVGPTGAAGSPGNPGQRGSLCTKIGSTPQVCN